MERLRTVKTSSIHPEKGEIFEIKLFHQTLSSLPLSFFSFSFFSPSFHPFFFPS